MTVNKGNKGKATIVLLGPFFPASGGICSNIQNILESPLKKRYNFSLFQTGSLKYGTAGYFDEKNFSKICRAIRDLFRYTIFLLNHSPDIVHINTSFGYYSFWRDSLYVLITKFFRRKLILQIHGGMLDEFCQKSPLLLRKFIRKILEMPKQIFVLSSFQQRPFEHLGIRQRVEVIPNMIDASKFDRNDNSQDKLDIPSGSIVILFVAAHFFREKGVWETLHAVPLVINKYKKALFILIGAGSEENRMKIFCKNKKLQNFVRFKRNLYGKDLINVFLASDIFVLPSYSEGFPLVILEAMSAGLPVISTPVGAIPEIIEEGVNGFLVPPEDSTTLASRIIQLIENDVLRERMGANSRKKVKEKYDVKAVAGIFDRKYRELIFERNHNEASCSKL